MNSPLIFKADPTVVRAGKLFQLTAFLSALYLRPVPGRQPFEKTAKDVDERIPFKDDHVSLYEDHIEQKHGVAVREIYFTTITGVEVARTPGKKIICITIYQGSESFILTGFERMDDLLQIITSHLKQGLIKERVFDGRATLWTGFKPFILSLLLLAVLLLTFSYLGWLQ